MEFDKEESEPILFRVKSTDGDIFETNLNFFMHVPFMQGLMNYLGTEQFLRRAIPLTVSSNILKKLLSWLNHHKDNIHVTNTSEWDLEFVHSLGVDIFAMFNAAHYLDLKGLQHVILSSKKVRQSINIFERN